MPWAIQRGEELTRKPNTVLSSSLDRLSREGPLAILTLVNGLKHCGVAVVSHQES